MKSSVKKEALDSEECHGESANACPLNIKEEPLQLEYNENTGNLLQMKLEENVKIEVV